MADKINILFVAFEFPPLGGPGVQRSLKFVKYLPQFDINPIVITVKKEDYPLVMPYHAIDPTLSADIPASTIIERIHCKSPKPAANKFIRWARIYFSIYENFKKYWKEELEKNLPLIIEKYKPSAVYVSLPPFAMAPLWMELLEKYRLPLIIDFRDAWSQWCFAVNATRIHYLLKLKLEAKVLERAAKVICSSKQTMIDMMRVHPGIPAAKFSVITNGYDDEIISDDILNIPVTEKIIIGYVGSFYYTPSSRKQIFTPWWKKPPHRMLNYTPRKEDWLYRSPYFFLKTVRHLIDKEPGFRNRLVIRFAGHTPGWLLSQIESFSLEDICRHEGYLNHDAVITFQNQCDALLITSAKVIAGRDYSIAGKTFEYFTMGKPILAFVSEGAQKDLLTETGMAAICNPDDTAGSALILQRLFDGQLQLHPVKHAIEKYHRKYLTQKLAGLIKDISSKKILAEYIPANRKQPL